MDKEKKPPVWERTANFLEKLHYGIGLVAVGGFLLEELSGAAIIRPEVLALAAGYELAHGFIINVAKNWFKNRRQNQGSPKLAAAH